MLLIEKEKNRKLARKKRISSRIEKHLTKPMVSVYRSNKHFYMQVFSEKDKTVLLAINNVQKDYKNIPNTKEGIKKLAQILAEKMLSKGIKSAIFNRNGYVYHGLVKEACDSLRSNGIEV